MSFYMKLTSFAEEKSFLIKAIFISLMGFVAFFIDKDNPWLHWTWLLYFTFTTALLLLEYREDQMKRQSPLMRMKRYLQDFKGWRQSAGNTEYYEPAPEFTIKPSDEKNNLSFTQEWTRGEVGYHNCSGNSAYYTELYFNDIQLEKIHMVSFDGGKKSIVAPDWKAISGGRIYFYTQNSIRYLYQKFYAQGIGKDFSKDTQKVKAAGEFDIPVFKDDNEVKKFMDYCDTQTGMPVLRCEEKQNTTFYELLEKYQVFRQGCK
jgi:hypothetical protein